MNSKQDLAQLIFREIGIINDRMDLELKEKLPSELPPAQFKLLNHLIFTTNTNETVSDVAKLFHVTLSAMSQIAKQLAGKQLISLQTSAEDSRRKTIVITPLGRKAHTDALSKISFDLEPLAQRFSQKNLQSLFENIQQFRLEFENLRT